MPDEEFLEAARDEYNLLTKRILWAQSQVKHYTTARDEIVARVRAVQRKDDETAEVFRISRARVGQILRRWRANHAK